MTTTPNKLHLLFYTPRHVLRFESTAQDLAQQILTRPDLHLEISFASEEAAARMMERVAEIITSKGADVLMREDS